MAFVSKKEIVTGVVHGVQADLHYALAAAPKVEALCKRLEKD